VLGLYDLQHLALVRGATAQLRRAFALGVYDVPNLTVVRVVTAQHWCAFALGVYDLPHLTLVRRVTTQLRRAFALGACQWCLGFAHLQCPLTLGVIGFTALHSGASSSSAP